MQASFSVADEKIAANLYRRGVSAEQVRCAVLLGCARKYVAMINGQIRLPVTSLHYFVGLIDEVTTSTTIPDSYWEALKRKVHRMEASWLRANSQNTKQNDVERA